MKIGNMSNYMTCIFFDVRGVAICSCSLCSKKNAGFFFFFFFFFFFVFHNLNTIKCILSNLLHTILYNSYGKSRVWLFLVQQWLEHL